MTAEHVRLLVGLGSNIEPETHLAAAVTLLAEFDRVVGVSHAWESAPVGFHDQPNFVNAAALLETSRSAAQLCREIFPALERRLNRRRDPSNRNAPRTIDVDLALYGSFVGRVDHREIPDPDILEREFLAVSLAELAPDFVHPTDGRTLAQIARSLRGTSTGLFRRDDLLTEHTMRSTGIGLPPDLRKPSST